MTDSITQYLRAHTEQLSAQPKKSRSHRNSRAQHWYDFLPGYQYQYYFIFDCETTVDARQALKFGTYEIHGLDRDSLASLYLENNLADDSCDELIERGVFVNIPALLPEELLTIIAYCDNYDIRCLTKDQFVSLLYEYCHNQDKHALLIGHNLSFDLSRLAEETACARGEFTNGFSLKLCTCTWTRKRGKRYTGDSCRVHPNIRIKKISPHCHLYDYAGKQRGNFLDTATLARALLGPGSLSLDALGTILHIAHGKLTDNIEHGKITTRYLDYACRDVTATFEIFLALRAIYASYNFSRKITTIYSEASLGKALYKELKISPPMQRMQNISPETHGYAMSAYYGGRAEVHLRLTPCEIRYTDFKSEYPTIFALMDLQELLLARRFEQTDCTERTRKQLENFSLNCLLQSYYWQSLRVLCKIKGTGLILPVRAKFNGQNNNIALCTVNLSETWYTLSDVLAGLLLGGATPEIIQAIEIIPLGCIRTRKHALFGGLVTINPAKQDIFVSLINERTRLKQAAKQASPDKERLERAQLALKLLANATSYGINIELVSGEEKEDVRVYGNGEPFAVKDVTPQKPGLFYCPLIGCHIPAGGRLLLAIAQRLAHDCGITYALCDTDSMTFVRPENMSREAFNRHIDAICSFFTILSPYAGQHALLELEDVNRWQGNDEPLFCLAISAKRYCLYNRTRFQYRLRKISAHGLGAYHIPEYERLQSIPLPCSHLSELGLSAHAHWIYDLWYTFVEDCENGVMSLGYAGTILPGLDIPVQYRATIATANLYRRFEHIDGMRPFNFLTVLSGEQKTYYSAYTTRITSDTKIYEIKSNTLANKPHLQTVSEALTGYFRHPENKATNGRMRGEMRMREVVITSQIAQGKETSYELLALENAGLPDDFSSEEIDKEYPDIASQHATLKEQCERQGLRATARRLGCAPSTLSRYLARLDKKDRPAS